jgi:hypothetical protein
MPVGDAAERRINMNTMRQFVVFAMITLSVGFSAAWAESKDVSKAEKKIRDKFKMKWTRISYSKTVSLFNKDGSTDKQQDVSEGMSLSCEVDILDSNHVLGVSRGLVIVKMTDDKGGDIKIDSKKFESFQMSYEAPRYNRQFVPPKRPAKWKTVVRSALRLPPEKISKPQMVERVRPTRMQLDLNIGLGDKSTGEISHVKGYFYALIAESYEYVDIPFKTSDKWVRLTPDVEVQIVDAWSKDSSYRLSTKGRPDRRHTMRQLSFESSLPKRLVMDRQLIGPDDKAVRHNRNPFLPYWVGGNSSGSGSNMDQITKIRYVIAVNPVHYEIPFVLKDIPLPKP